VDSRGGKGSEEEDTSSLTLLLVGEGNMLRFSGVTFPLSQRRGSLISINHLLLPIYPTYI